jgi:PIN domain nuclease of toxin-antitoxin system
MIAGVADTPAALWYLFSDPRPSVSAKSAFDAAASSRRKIVVSAISLADSALDASQARFLNFEGPADGIA